MSEAGIPAGSLLAGHDAILCDLDGVVYAGPSAIPGAVEALERAAAAGVPVAFVTNNASRTPEAVAEHLNSLGVSATPEAVFGSARAGARLAREDAEARGNDSPTAMVIGADSLREEATKAGFGLVEVSATAHPDYVLQGFSPELGWSDIAAAAFAIQRGARWVATNTDLTIPRAEGIAPGNGSLVAAVRLAVDVEPLVAGKPEPALMRLAARELGAARPLVIGDRLDTDVAGGVSAGFDTVLVLTGVDTLTSAQLAPEAQRPRFVVETLAGLFAPAQDAVLEARA